MVVKCVLSERALEVVGSHQIDEVFRGRRLVVVGTINYKALGVIATVDAVDVRFFPPRVELPSVDDILDDDFTGGLSSEEYLAKLRDGRLS